MINLNFPQDSINQLNTTDFPIQKNLKMDPEPEKRRGNGPSVATRYTGPETDERPTVLETVARRTTARTSNRSRNPRPKSGRRRSQRRDAGEEHRT